MLVMHGLGYGGETQGRSRGMSPLKYPMDNSGYRTHEDGGYLFNSIVPLKFTENSETA